MTLSQNKLERLHMASIFNLARNLREPTRIVGTLNGTFSGSAVVDLSPHNLKVEGSSPATIAGRERMAPLK